MRTTALAFSLLIATGASSAGKPHVHGAATLDVALEATRLTLALDTPLDGLLGFERAPRTDAERRAAEQAITTLRAADSLFITDPDAGCRLASVELASAALKLGATPAGKDDGHADLEAEFAFDCTKSPRFVDVGLFKAFPRITRLAVQAVTPGGQRKLSLTRAAARIELAR